MPQPRAGYLGSCLRSGAYLLVGYVGLLSMLLFFENRLVYHPVTAEQDWAPPPSRSGIEDVELASADGTRLHAWWCPHTSSDQAILYCHGNAGNLSHRGASIVKLREQLGVSVLIIDYPGYGKSDGAPSEKGCYGSAEAAYAWLTDTKKIAPKKIVLYGVSLGGGVITDLASRKEHRALVLISPFTSLPDVASSLYWWLPAPKRLLMTNQMDNLSKIRNCRRPIFIVHGTADRLIPYALGERLFEEANEPKRFLSILNGDHNDALPTDFYTSLKQFLTANPID